VLESWLNQPPGPKLVEAWKRYTQTIWPYADPHEREEVRQTSASIGARSVAEAAGSFLALRLGHHGQGTPRCSTSWRRS